MVMAMTDNQNRTKSELKTIFERHGGSTGEPGSVSYVFSGSEGTASYRIPVDSEGTLSIQKLLEALEEQEDVEIIRHNADLPEAILPPT